jgi:hypothetical protein
MRVLLPFLVLASLLTSGTPERGFRRKPELSPLARSLLTQRMETHAEMTTELMWSVVFLEHEVTAEVADALAKQPRIARPNPDRPDVLNSHLPKKFFDLQDDFTRKANDLARAAEKGDNVAIAARFGDLMNGCVSCHAAYLDAE